IGLYSIAGALIVCGVRWPRHRSDGGGMAAALQIFGIAIGTAPCIAYLASKGALEAFFETSFVTIPRIIDAVWSLPFPDLTSTFRSKNLNLHTLSDFFLYEHFRYILNPLVICLAILVLLWRRKRMAR